MPTRSRTAVRRSSCQGRSVVDTRHSFEACAQPRNCIAISLAFATGGASTQLLDAVYAAIEAPGQFPRLLQSTATSHEPAAQLEALARIAATAATSEQQLATAVVYAAVAVAGTDRDEALTRLRQARQLDPGSAAEWSRLLLTLRSTRPAALVLLDALLAEPPEEPT
jgi:hypothetical protein